MREAVDISALQSELTRWKLMASISLGVSIVCVLFCIFVARQTHARILEAKMRLEGLAVSTDNRKEAQERRVAP